jgi:hypothetical protein
LVLADTKTNFNYNLIFLENFCEKYKKIKMCFLLQTGCLWVVTRFLGGYNENWRKNLQIERKEVRKWMSDKCKPTSGVFQGGISPVNSKFRWDDGGWTYHNCTSGSSLCREGVLLEKQSNNLKEQMYSWLLDEMEAAECAGLGFSVDGRYYTTEEAGQLYQVMENAYYMKSYVEDDSGRITQIDFDHLENV